MKKLLILFFILSYSLHSQKVSIFDIDPSGFPTVKGKFYTFDENGKQVRPVISDLSLTEDGIQRKITFIDCPEESEPVNLSVAMSIDVSGSMSNSKSGEVPVEFGKTTAMELTKSIVAPKTEFALQTCDQYARILQDFTSDKEKIFEKIPPIYAYGDNDFVEHLLNPNTGILNIAKTGKYKRVAILYTDAWWYPLTNEELQMCLDTCSKYSIQFYAVIYTRPEVEPDGIKKSLRLIAEATGGKLYDGITSFDAAKSIAEDLQISIQANNPCNIEWISEPTCDFEDRQVNLFWNNLNSLNSYPPPSAAYANLILNPSSFKFGPVPPGTNIQKNLTLTAQNTEITVTDIKMKYGSSTLKIVNVTFPLVIPMNSSKQVSIEFSPIDSNMNYSVFDVLTNFCDYTFSSSGGYPGKPLSGKTLKLTFPNGGETFVVGSDSIIKWQGLGKSDTVSLKFSNDNGATWSFLTSQASELKYNWLNIPGPSSKNCLVKVIYGSEEKTPRIEWEKCFGGSDRDMASIVQQTTEGGYISLGTTYSTNGNVTGNHGLTGDIWVTKTDDLGTLQWQKCLGGDNYDVANNLIQTSDGGYVISGYTFSNNGDVKNQHGNTDIWIVKLNDKGQILWQNCLGGSNFEYSYILQKVNTGGFILLGLTNSNNGDVTGYKNFDDIWLIKVSDLGKIEWQKCLGGSKFENANSMIQTSDGGFLIGAFTESSDGDVAGNHGNWDFWLIKLDKSGNIIWKKCYGGSSSEYAYKIMETDEGGFMFAGESSSSNGDVSGNHSNSDDIWLVKIDNLGNIEWQKSYGGDSKEHFKNIYQTSDKGFFVIAETYSNNGDISGYHGNNDIWIFKVNITGDIQWQKCLGGSARESIGDELNTLDGGYILLINSSSNDGDITGNHGNTDIWIVKVNETGSIEWRKCIGGELDENGSSIEQTMDSGYIIAGYSNSKKGDVTGNKGDNDFWIVKLSPEGYSQEDASDSVFSIVEPKISSQDIDMQKCIFGNIKDSILVNFVENTGTYKVRIDSVYFTGTDANAFMLASGIPRYELIPGETKTTELLFKPTRIGLHNAQIHIISQSEKLIQNIIGEGIAPAISVQSNLLDFGLVEVGSSMVIQDTALIRNVSSNPVVIKDVIQLGPDLEQFEILSGGGSFILQPNEVRKLDIRFRPKYSGRTSGQLGFLFDEIGSPAVTQLFGKGIGGLVYVADDSAYVGEQKTLRLYIDNVVPDSLAKIASNFSTKIRFQSSILAPINNSDWTIINDSILISLTGQIVSSKLLAEIPVLPGLGSVKSTSLDIIEFNLKDNLGKVVEYEFEKYPGTFKLLGICKDGGTRLINPSGKAGIQSIAPNPAGNSIDIEFSSSEIGFTEIAIYNTLGEKVLTVFSEDISETGKRNIKINSSEIGNGTYMVIFKSPTVVDTKQIMIVK